MVVAAKNYEFNIHAILFIDVRTTSKIYLKSYIATVVSHDRKTVCSRSKQSYRVRHINRSWLHSVIFPYKIVKPRKRSILFN